MADDKYTDLDKRVSAAFVKIDRIVENEASYRTQQALMNQKIETLDSELHRHMRESALGRERIIAQMDGMTTAMNELLVKFSASEGERDGSANNSKMIIQTVTTICTVVGAIIALSQLGVIK